MSEGGRRRGTRGTRSSQSASPCASRSRTSPRCTRGPDPIAASPLSLRGLILRTGSDAVGVCLDVGHAHIVAELRHTSLARLVEPVADLVVLVHLHDNLGARQLVSPEAAIAVDPLRLDLHLAPGAGTLPIAEAAQIIAETSAPVVLEVHPPHRPPPAELFQAVSSY